MIFLLCVCTRTACEQLSHSAANVAFNPFLLSLMDLLSHKDFFSSICICISLSLILLTLTYSEFSVALS